MDWSYKQYGRYKRCDCANRGPRTSEMVRQTAFVVGILSLGLHFSWPAEGQETSFPLDASKRGTDFFACRIPQFCISIRTSNRYDQNSDEVSRQETRR